MTQHSQYDSFVVAGHWWLPGQAEQIAGELHYEAGKLSLRLFGGSRVSKLAMVAQKNAGLGGLDAAMAETLYAIGTS